MKRVILLLFVLTILMLTANLVRVDFKAVVVHADIVVSNGSSIQEAIDNASEGSTILVSSGRFVERLKISKRLVLIGNGVSTVVENNIGSTTIEIPLGVNGVTLAGFFVNATVKASNGILIKGQNSIIENNTVANHNIGMCIYDSAGNTLRGNYLIDNKYNLKVWGLSLSHFLQDIDESNFVGGKRVCYLVNQTGTVVPSDAGYVGIINSRNVTVKDVNLTNNYSGILLAYTNSSLIWHATCSKNTEGLRLVRSNNNEIIDNEFTMNEWAGLSLIISSNNRIFNNTMNSNRYGISLSYSNVLPSIYSSNNSIGENRFGSNYYGLYFDSSFANHVFSNSLFANTIAICLDMSSLNRVVGNNISKNTDCGVKIVGSESNSFYYNSFSGNALHVEIAIFVGDPLPINDWDNGYPCGGNYWSGYNGRDLHSGIYQNASGSDGIGDTAYDIATDNVDEYPLMDPLGAFNAGTWSDFTYYVSITSNSTISDFHFDPAAGSFVKFNVTGQEGTLGYCRVQIPKTMLSVDDGWNVTANGVTLNWLTMSDGDSTYLYFTYDHSSRVITIEGTHAIPEFSVFPFLLFFMSMSLVAVGFRQRMDKRSIDAGG